MTKSTKKRYYKNRKEKREVPCYRSTWYYLGQLADQMGMSTEEYAQFALQSYVSDRRPLLKFDRKWTGE